MTLASHHLISKQNDDFNRQVVAEIRQAELALEKLEVAAEQRNQQVKQARKEEQAAARALQALLAERHEKERAAREAHDALQQQQAPQHAVLVRNRD